MLLTCLVHYCEEVSRLSAAEVGSRGREFVSRSTGLKVMVDWASIKQSVQSGHWHTICFALVCQPYPLRWLCIVVL